MSVLDLVSEIGAMLVNGYWVRKDRRNIQDGREGRIEAEIRRSKRHLDEMYPPRAAKESPELADQKETL